MSGEIFPVILLEKKGGRDGGRMEERIGRGGETRRRGQRKGWDEEEGREGKEGGKDGMRRRDEKGRRGRRGG